MYGAKFLRIGVLGAALLLAGTVQAANRALLVGVGAYQHVNPLPGIDIDIDIMRQWAPLLGFTEIEVLQDQQATYANVHAALQRLVGNLGDGDHALFYFSGHGAQFKDIDGDEKDDTKDEALILYDTTWEGDKARNVLLDDEIGALIGSMKSGQLLMLVDACHSGTVDKSISNRGLVPLAASEYAPATTGEVKGLGYFDIPAKTIDVVARDPRASTRYVAINAAQDNQRSRASSHGSFFTLGLDEAFKAAQSSSGITPQALRDRVAAFIQANVRPKENQFTPQLQGNPELFNQNLALASRTHESPHGELWAQFQEMLKQYDHAGMTLSTDRGKRVQISQWYTLELQLPPDRGGYLSVIAVDSGSEEATVLFPNDWVDQVEQARFEPGATVKLPPSDTANWGLRALPPASTTLIVALITPEPLGLYEKGIRESRIDPRQKVFARLSPAGLWTAKTTLRSTAAQAKSTAGADDKVAAAKVIVEFYH